MRSFRHLPRTAVTLLSGFLATILASVAVIVLSRLSPTGSLIEKVARAWSWAILGPAGVDLDVRGASEVDATRSYVVVANHASLLDIMVCFVAIPVPIRFLAKQELFRIPLLAAAMRAIGIVPVDRAARGAVHEQINVKARELVEAGRSLIVYPEGTRTREDALGTFKKGAFTIAVSTGLPLLPVAIHGSHRAWPPGSPWVRGGPIRVVVGAPIPTEGKSSAQTSELRDEARRVIAEQLQALAAQS